MHGSGRFKIYVQFSFLQCLYLPFPYIISPKDEERLFSFFFTLHIFLSRYFLKTELFISDTFLRRINIIQHSFQRHLHAKVTFFVFFHIPYAR